LVAVKVVVREARGGTVRYWLRILLSLSPFMGHNEDEDRDAPTVLVRSASGVEYVLLRTGFLRQANRAADRFRGELQQLGEQAFRQRYGLPQEPS
jgi:hypothetical protein